MKNLFLAGICLMAQTLHAQEAPEIPHAAAPLSVNVELVELHVTVMDGQGRPIGGLRKENFKVTENNIIQPITFFKHEDIPVSLGLVLDNSRSIEPRKARLDAASLAFVQQSNPEDETFVVHFDSEVRLSQGFTSDRNTLEEQLAAAKPFGQTAFLDALLLGLDQMESARHTKKAILLVTDGIDNASKATLPEVVERLRRANVIVYTVGLLSASGGLKAEESLVQIAEAGGGRAYFPETPEQARTAMEIIARDLREQYTVGYLPTHILRNGAWRSVRVDITPPKGFPTDLTTNYRRGYYAPEQ
jgi:Ca-activated chloride channel family protein